MTDSILKCGPGFPIPSSLKRSGKTICSSLNDFFGARLQLVIEERDACINTVQLSIGGGFQTVGNLREAVQN